MFRTLFAMFMLPVVGILLLVGVIVESAQAQTPAATSAARPHAAPAPKPGSAPAPASYEGMGGPNADAADLSRLDSGDDETAANARWRLGADPDGERRFAPPPVRRFNQVTVRF